MTSAFFLRAAARATSTNANAASAASIRSPLAFLAAMAAGLALHSAPAQAQSTAALPALTPEAALAGSGARAQLVAVQQVVISSELAGRITQMPLREGQRFRKGATLIAYDCALNRARLQRASQAQTAARQKLKVAQELDALGSISKADVEQAHSALAIAQSETALEQVMVQRCTVTAPFDGRVGETFVREAETVAEGKALLSIYDDRAFEVETIVPSRWLAWLQPGYPLQIAVDETGQVYPAKVVRIAGSVDPVSQSVKVIGQLSHTPSAQGAPLLPGMSGTVHISAPSQP